MKRIKNPNDIVDEIVKDYKNAFNEKLQSVIMYGSAVTHEYNPSSSDINIAVVLEDNSISVLGNGINVQKKWNKKNVAPPFYLTQEYIATSLDSYPVEFLDMRSNYRVLFGDDMLSGIEIKLVDLRLQIERELKGLSIHLKKAFLQSEAKKNELFSILKASMGVLVPVFRALLVLKHEGVPSSKSDIISDVEDKYNLEGVVFSEVFQIDFKKFKSDQTDLFSRFVRNVDRIIQIIETIEFKELDNE